MGIVIMASSMFVSSTLAYYSGTADVKKNAWSIVQGEQNQSNGGKIIETEWDKLADTDQNQDGIPDQADNMSPNHEFTKDPAIQNLSNYPAYVFVKVEVPATLVNIDDENGNKQENVIRDLVRIKANTIDDKTNNNIVGIKDNALVTDNASLIPDGNPDTVSSLIQSAAGITPTNNGGYGDGKWILVYANPVEVSERDSERVTDDTTELKSTYIFMYTSILQNGKEDDTDNISKTLFTSMYEPDFSKVAKASTSVDVSGALIQTEDISNGAEALKKLVDDEAIDESNSLWHTTPIIKNDHGILRIASKISPEATIQWYKDGVAVEGATGKELTDAEGGDYTVVVTYPNAVNISSNKVGVAQATLLSGKKFNSKVQSMAENANAKIKTMEFVAEEPDESQYTVKESVASENSEGELYAYLNPTTNDMKIYSPDGGSKHTYKLSNDLSEMFEGMVDATSIDLGDNFDTSNVTDMNNMFCATMDLTSLNLGSKFDTSKVTNMNNMFLQAGYSSTNPLEVDFSKFDGSSVSTADQMFAQSNFKDINLSNFSAPELTSAANMFNKLRGTESVDISNFNANKLTSAEEMFYDSQNLTSIKAKNFGGKSLTNMDYMFGCDSKLTDVDISNMNVENVTDMSSAFFNCLALKEVDLSSFNTKSLTNMGSMFEDCTNLKTIYASSDFDTSHINTGTWVFSGCDSLVGGYGTTFANYYDMGRATGKDIAAAHIDGTELNETLYNKLTSGDTYNKGNVINRRAGLFTAKNSSDAPAYTQATMVTSNDITSLSALLGSAGINTSDIKTIDFVETAPADGTYEKKANIATDGFIWAYYNSADGSLKINSPYNETFKLGNTGYAAAGIFNNMNNVTSIRFGDQFDTSEVTNMIAMFSGMSNLKTIEFGKNFTTSNVTNMVQMFVGCTRLTTIKVSKDFDISKVASSNGMFGGTAALVGGNGTTYRGDHSDASYAHIDTADNPGYFTAN